ncbi:MAG: rhodanese-like domain-containing protein [Ignavibacteriales bacterium]|nr:rhodanese-like domain-containing protein [Ignavibacteriales bacterium]
MKEWFMKLSRSKKLAMAAAFLGIIALFIANPTDDNKIYVNAKEMALSTVKDQDKIDVMTLADWLIKEKSDFTLVDLRNEKEYSEYNIPTSVNIRMEDLLGSGLMRNQTILLYGIDDISAAQAWFVLKSSNYKGVYILSGGLNEWKNQILFPKLALNATPEQTAAFEKAKQISAYFGGTPQLATAEQTTSAASPTIKPTTPVLPKLSTPAVGGKAVKKKKEGC